jgi:hypothetical protein
MGGGESRGGQCGHDIRKKDHTAAGCMNYHPRNRSSPQCATTQRGRMREWPRACTLGSKRSRFKTILGLKSGSSGRRPA